MSDKFNSDSDMQTDQPILYQIRIGSHLGSQWTDWFEGMTITREENGETILTGQVADQAQLHGLLKKIRDLGITLISISPIDPSHL